jgi:NifB/MoaA-like Fe-S oxidoreductase
MVECDECYRTEFGLKRDHCSIDNRSGSTHPGTEQGAMRSSLMLGMVSCMLDRLCLCQSADGKNTDHQEDRQKFESDLVHQRSTQYGFSKF